MNKVLLIIILSACHFLSAQTDILPVNKGNVETPQIDYKSVKVSQSLSPDDKWTIQLDQSIDGTLDIQLNGESTPIAITQGKGEVALSDGGLNFVRAGRSLALVHHNLESGQLKAIPFWTSLIPPLITILFALLIKEVLISLFIGIWSGVMLINGGNFFSPKSWIESLMTAVDTYVINAVADKGHLSVIIFSFMIGAMVALISKNGGMMGVVNKLGRFAKTRKSTQKITWLLGILIFFDDYANTLIVGNTMRSVTDKFRISREKLAYIVDSTAAPVAAIAFITTWIGAELGYIGDSMAMLGLEETQTPYALFFASLKYSFYPILTLVFIYFIISQGKDYGPMYKAEVRAITTGQVSPAATENEDEPNMEDLSPVAGATPNWWYATVPIFAVIIVTILGLLVTGFDSASATYDVQGSWGTIWQSIDAGNAFSKLGTLIGMSDSYAALIWASFSGLALALIITVATRTLPLLDSVHWLITGFKTMLPAILVLVLAWSLAGVTEALHTSAYLSNLFSDKINPFMLPALIFVLAAFIAFATGSSWSTMAILYPIAIPTAYAVCQSAGLDADISHEILLCIIATVLAASVLGDHCSPISDTTILSSLATDCNHLDHVKTQLPYALTVGLVSVVGITLSLLLGGGWIISGLCLALCLGVLYAWIRYYGKATPRLDPQHSPLRA